MERKFALFQRVTRAVSKPASQQLRREGRPRERKSPFVSPPMVNSFSAKSAPDLGFFASRRLPERTFRWVLWRRERNWDPTLSVFGCFECALTVVRKGYGQR